MSNHATYRARDAGRTLANIIANTQTTPTSVTLTYGTITNVYATNNVKYCDVKVNRDTITQIRYTTACGTPTTGARCLLLTSHHHTTIIGILA